MARHAYLVMAHTDFPTLRRLLSVLDDDRNDIYLHVDARAQAPSAAELAGVVRRSRLVLTPRSRVGWGGYSQVECELMLLREATARPHRFYHLSSGADLPLLGQDASHQYFDDHDGTEFVHLAGADDDWLLERVRRKHLFTEHGRSRVGRVRRRTMTVLDRGYAALQTLTGTDRRADERPVVKGSQWFSITDDLARYVLDHEPWIRARFRRAICPDEFFLQTLVWSSPFRERLHHGVLDDDYRASLRKIDWGRGWPYVWRSQDLDELRAAPEDGYLFARKFDSAVDTAVIDALVAGVLDGRGR